jgi:hypothetical protein
MPPSTEVLGFFHSVPPGRIASSTPSRHFVPSYSHSVPPGRIASSTPSRHFVPSYFHSVPPGRIASSTPSRNFVPSYSHSVPPGRIASSTCLPGTSYRATLTLCLRDAITSSTPSRRFRTGPLSLFLSGTILRLFSFAFLPRKNRDSA